MEKAYENDGCVRYWDPVTGPHFTNEAQDTVIVANDPAKPMVESIKSIFPNINVDESLKQ
jgi:hypothetical protein